MRQALLKPLNLIESHRIASNIVSMDTSKYTKPVKNRNLTPFFSMAASKIASAFFPLLLGWVRPLLIGD